MKVATFNINNVRGRLDDLLDWLAQEEPDVVCLQELTAEHGAFPIELLEQLGYQADWTEDYPGRVKDDSSRHPLR